MFIRVANLPPSLVSQCNASHPVTEQEAWFLSCKAPFRSAHQKQWGVPQKMLLYRAATHTTSDVDRHGYTCELKHQQEKSRPKQVCMKINQSIQVCRTRADVQQLSQVHFTVSTVYTATIQINICHWLKKEPVEK